MGEGLIVIDTAEKDDAKRFCLIAIATVRGIPRRAFAVICWCRDENDARKRLLAMRAPCRLIQIAGEAGVDIVAFC